jgi:hypothetical protein
VYAILGIVTYYIGTFVGEVILGILDSLIGIGFDWDNNLALGSCRFTFRNWCGLRVFFSTQD